MLRAVEPARGAERNPDVVAAGDQRHAALLILGNAVARDDQAVEAVARAAARACRWQHAHRLRRVVERRVEVDQVVALRVGRRRKLVAHAELDAQVRAHAPGVGGERLIGVEAEEAHRVGRRLGVGPEVAEQRVGQRVARGVRVTRRG